MRLNDLLIRALWNTTAEDITAPYISFISRPLSVLVFSQSAPIKFCHRYREWELTICWTLHFFFLHPQVTCMLWSAENHEIKKNEASKYIWPLAIA